jgi:hypothetical protein
VRLACLARPITLRVQRVAFPGPSQSGRVVATFRMMCENAGVVVQEWSRETGDLLWGFESTQEAVAYVGTRIHAINHFASAQAFYARQLGRAGWVHDR